MKKNAISTTKYIYFYRNTWYNREKLERFMEKRIKKTAAIFTIIAFITLLCFIPFGTISANAEEECTHKRKEKIDWLFPTCAKEGYDEFFCLD